MKQCKSSRFKLHPIKLWNYSSPFIKMIDLDCFVEFQSCFRIIKHPIKLRHILFHVWLGSVLTLVKANHPLMGPFWSKGDVLGH